MKDNLVSSLKTWASRKLRWQTAPSIGRCDCKPPVKADITGYVEKAYLQSGQHTAFGLLRCRRCKRIAGFPNDNLTLALEQGTPNTKVELMGLMGLPVPLPIAYSYVLGGVSACSLELYRSAIDKIADLCQRENTESFYAEVREHEKTLPCDLD